LAEKVNRALANNLKVIFCCGESLTQRKDKIHFNWIKKQLSEGLFYLSVKEFDNIVIAYEPIWAIGTGMTATNEQAQEMHQFIRNCLNKKYGSEVAEDTSILYGGSCNPVNAKELFSQTDIDGGLIGGASLKADDFLSIINSF
jgi:triosephosphate isomerase